MSDSRMHRHAPCWQSRTDGLSAIDSKGPGFPLEPDARIAHKRRSSRASNGHGGWGLSNESTVQLRNITSILVLILDENAHVVECHHQSINLHTKIRMADAEVLVPAG